MRSDATMFALTAPASIEEALHRLAEQPGQHTIIAGGTELMVALGAGRLQHRSLLSLHKLRNLRFIEDTGDAIVIGSGTTFTDLRRSRLIAEHLPLIAQSASWTGSVANQNRATLGGNICNSSPAADTPPVLLAYGASVTLISASGQRTLPYSEFHRGYKKTALRADELLHSIRVPQTFAGYRQYLRKVGTRNAQAISKVALAVIARVEGEKITDIRIGAASLADRPARCSAVEAATLHAPIHADAVEDTIRAARVAMAKEAKPIDDIRSTEKYRRAVAQNLIEEFLRSLA